MELLIRLILLALLTLVTSRPERRKEARREFRAVVPQLLPNYTTTTLPPASSVFAWLEQCGANSVALFG